MAQQDTLTARMLLNNAYYMLNIKRRGETIEGEESVFSIGLLNEILERHTSNGAIVPYFTTISFTLTPNKGSYVVGMSDDADVKTRRIIELDYAQFKTETTLQQINILGKTNYYGSSRVDSLDSLPYNVLLQNTTYDSTLIFYPAPDRNYECTLTVKQAFDGLELDDRLDEIPLHMRMFLRYALARELCEFHGGIQWTQKLEGTYQELLRALENASDMDLSVDGGDYFQPFGAEAVKNGCGL